MTPSPKLSSAFGAVVRQRRLKQGLSQEALAEMADIHRNYVGMLERGQCSATLDIADRIARALEIPLEQLVAQATRASEHGLPVHPRRKKV